MTEVRKVEITYNNVKYEISCLTCCHISLKAIEDNFSDEVIIYNLKQMSTCRNVHHDKLQ